MKLEDERDVLDLVAFLLVSARNLVSEPPRYGPLRLVEASRRLIGMLERQGVATTFLADVASSAADMPSLLMRSEEEFVRSLDRLVGAVSAQLAASAQTASDSQ